MDYDVSDLLENLFGNTVPGVIVTEAQPIETADPLSVALFTDWEYRPDLQGRMGWQSPDLPEAVPFEALPQPGEPCARCGSLEKWWDILGGEHCQKCGRPVLEKAMQWADRAARLRQQAPTQKPAPRIAPGCVPAVPVDMLDLVVKRPKQGESEALRGCEGG